MTNLRDRSIMVHLTTHKPGNAKKDKKISAEVSQSKGIDEDNGSYNIKCLGSRKTMHSSIKKGFNWATDVYMTHIKYTVPWLDGGWRILSSAKYLDYRQKIQDKMVELEIIRDEIRRNYSEIRKEGEINLGSAFNEETFPTADQICGDFGTTVDSMSLPNSEDFRTKEGLSEEDKKKIEEECVNRYSEQMRDSELVNLARMKECLTHFVKLMSDKDKGFKKNSFENLEEIGERVIGLNITDNQAIEDLANRAKDLATKYNPELVRHNQNARADNHMIGKTLVEDLEELEKQLEGF